MHSPAALVFLLAAPAFAAGGEAAPVTFETLLAEMADLARLARWPEPAYRTVQYSSYDRRSSGPEAPGWFENADGFGGEPIPGFLRVLREPAGGKAGLYLVAEVEGPGAIVRGWSAGMGGVLRVALDPGPTAGSAGGALVWEGPAYEFLARRSAHFAKTAGIDLDAGDAFIQEDADYLPIPFGKGLRVTWEGGLRELHFYHLQVRRYAPGTAVRTFEPASDLKACEAALRSAAGDVKVAVTHYAPISATLQGEDQQIWAFMGSSRLAEAIDAGGADIAFHGHSHYGVERGITQGGVPVHNVSMPVLKGHCALFEVGE